MDLRYKYVNLHFLRFDLASGATGGIILEDESGKLYSMDERTIINFARQIAQGKLDPGSYDRTASDAMRAREIIRDLEVENARLRKMVKGKNL